MPIIRSKSAVALFDPVAVLQDRLGADWPHLRAARQRSSALLRRLRRELCHPHLVPPGTTLVVFGSLARRELTAGSDVDWTLLADGRADADHPQAAQRIRSRLREMGLGPPAEDGPFGNLTFSHGLIHRIGGRDDTNANTTRRLLLLLESAPVGNRGAYDRVVRGVLARYVEEDLVSPGDLPRRVPRFLQNDIARYWRTMAVDFAHKRREREARGWALRTAKLRISRKLTYAAGLLSCFSCDAGFASVPGGRSWRDARQVVDHLAARVDSTPLDILATTVLSFGEISGAGGRLFGAYDEFLGMLDDSGLRRHLDALPPACADADPAYQRVRALGAVVQDALTEIFFSEDTPLRALTMRYGVF